MVSCQTASWQHRLLFAGLQAAGLACVALIAFGPGVTYLGTDGQLSGSAGQAPLASLRAAQYAPDPARGEQHGAALFGAPEQHVWIVRHGDKYSSYPDCPEGRPLCYNRSLMGDNPPLTPCGVSQANSTARWLLAQSYATGPIRNIAVSPFTRTLQTSLPLAKALGLKLKVEYLVSEAMQIQGPFQPFNAGADAETQSQLREVADMWDLDYGSPPIPTPETPVAMYDARVAKCAKVMAERFPVSSGNLVVFTHATTSFSVAYGLCHGERGGDSQLKEFVDNQNAIAPGGVIRVVRGANGACRIEQTQNVAVRCGRTLPSKCNYSDYPAWYWADTNGKGPGNCA